MAKVTADDIRVLAQTEGDAVLVLVDNELRVVAGGEQVPRGRVVYRKADLLVDSGVEVTDAEAETLAGGLTSQLQ
ncbi:MAG: hypothetical protein FWJ93_10545 [Micromonosporaceae bacterium]